MEPKEIVKCWKNEQYAASLSDVERASIPDNPAGPIELSDEDLSGIAGGTVNSYTTCTFTHGSVCQTLSALMGRSCPIC